MEGAFFGTIVGLTDFINVVTVTLPGVPGLPGGRTFQVPKDAIDDRDAGGLALLPDTRIVHVFPTLRKGSGWSSMPVSVPMTVIESVQEWERKQKETAPAKNAAAA